MTEVQVARNRPTAFVAVCCLLSIGCGAHRIPEPPGIHPTEPHISWAIHAGTADDPEQLLVCDSQSRTDCVVGASRPERQTFATLHLYLHPASTDTTYTGTVQVGFFGGDQRAHLLDVKETIKTSEKPRGRTIYDLLPTQAGTYPMEIALNAATASGERREIREEVAVVIK